MKLTAKYQTRTYERNPDFADGDHQHLIVNIPRPGESEYNKELSKALFMLNRQGKDKQSHYKGDFGPRYDHEQVIRDFESVGIEIEIVK